MEVYSRVAIDSHFRQYYGEDHLKEMVEDKLFQEMKPMIVEKMKVTEENYEPTNSTHFTGEVVVLTKEEYRVLKMIEAGYYTLLAGIDKGEIR